MTAPGPVVESDALLELWRTVVARHGGRVALSDGQRTLTYRQLAAVAQRIAGRLAAAGAAPGRQVILQVNAPLDAVVCMVGVLETGAAFVLLEDGLPQAARLARVDRVGAVLSAGRGQPVDALPLPWVDLAPELDGVEPHGPVPDGTTRPGPAAYVMFTSGSTGQPKAVEIGRDALHGFSLAAADRLALRPGDRWLQLASLGFDVLIEEVFPALMTGGTVLCRPDSAAPDPQELHAMLGDMGVTIVELSTQYWREYARWLDVRNETTPPGLRRVLVGGERMDPDDWRRWERSGRAPLVHVYGLTECTVTSTMYDGRLPADAQEVPIGTPLANAEVTVRGADGLPVAAGELGEIHIGGPSLASGYVGDPEQTSRRFVPDPRAPEQRLYATGDRGRILPDGNLEFRGRMDDQLKVRGHRLEPASVERLLTADPEVAQAVVLLDMNTRTTLSACLVPAGPVPEVTPDRALPVTGERREQLLAGLAAELPDWAIPAGCSGRPSCRRTHTASSTAIPWTPCSRARPAPPPRPPLRQPAPTRPASEPRSPGRNRPNWPPFSGFSECCWAIPASGPTPTSSKVAGSRFSPCAWSPNCARPSPHARTADKHRFRPSHPSAAGPLDGRGDRPEPERSRAVGRTPPRRQRRTHPPWAPITTLS